MKSNSESNCLYITMLLCVFVLAGSGVNWVFGQDENPFGTSNKSQYDDPFSDHVQVAAENPFGDAVNENPFGEGDNGADPFAKNEGQNPIRDQAPKQPDAQLLAELKAYKQKLAQLEMQNVRLKQKTDACIHSEEFVTESYQRVIERLLNYSDESSHMIALEELIQLDARIPLTDKIEKRLMELAASEASVVRESALLWLAKNEPAKAVKLGFQLKGPWKPISTSKQNEMIQRALTEPAFFDFEETELLEIADLIRDNFSLNVMISSKVDSAAPITYKVSGLSLRTALNSLLAAHDLALHVYEDRLEIVPKTLPEPKQTFVYNVKGLLHDDLTLDGIEGQVNNMLTGQALDGKVLAIDKHRFSITASDSAHHKVAELLGQLR